MEVFTSRYFSVSPAAPTSGWATRCDIIMNANSEPTMYPLVSDIAM